jgi:hypothetical protein
MKTNRTIASLMLSALSLVAWSAREASAHEASCGANRLPESFELVGCDADLLCQATQHGSTWEAVCGATTLTGKIDRRGKITWTAADGSACKARLKDGQLSGSCEAAAGVCEIASQAPLPSARCVELPSALTISGCGVESAQCELVQDACNWQASCDGGASVISGRATGSGARWDLPDGSRCRTTLVDGALVGTCTAPLAEGETVATTCDVSAAPPADVPPAPTCEPLASGFAIEGCGFDTLCNVYQRGCLWEATCGDTVLEGRAEGSSYEWTTEDGKECKGEVRDGKLAGFCKDGHDRCHFKQKDPVPSASCVTVPSNISVLGCELEGDCQILQDGCQWQAACNDAAVYYHGLADETGISLITHISDAEFLCTAAVADGGLVGACTESLTEGSTTEPLSCDFSAVPPTPPEAVPAAP